MTCRVAVVLALGLALAHADTKAATACRPSSLAAVPGDITTRTADSNNEIFGVVADAEGNVLYTALQANAVKKVWANGSVTIFAGSSNGAGGSSGDGGPATAALLSNPVTATIDSTSGASPALRV